jgi:hypothetical protein
MGTSTARCGYYLPSVPYHTSPDVKEWSALHLAQVHPINPKQPMFNLKLARAKICTMFWPYLLIRHTSWDVSRLIESHGLVTSDHMLSRPRKCQFGQGLHVLLPGLCESLNLQPFKCCHMWGLSRCACPTGKKKCICKSSKLLYHLERLAVFPCPKKHWRKF